MKEQSVSRKKATDDYNNALPWYHGAISKQWTEKLLSANKDGLFLVKDSVSYPGDFSLCVKFRSKLYEYRIKRYYESKLTLDDAEFFESLEELIDTYRDRSKQMAVTLSHYVVKECNAEYISTKEICIDYSSCGEFGRVFVGTYNDRKVLLKVVKQVGPVEGMLRKSVCHENLINMIGLTTFNNKHYLVSSYARYSSLLDLLRNWSKTTCVRKFLYNFAYDICNGMEYLAKKCIMHKYLAARNVWISRNGLAKLSNFGLCDEYIERSKQQSYRHQAPEVLISKRYSVSGDMWSFGVTLWEMFSNGSVPYTELAYFRILKQLRRGIRLSKPRGCPNDMYATMTNCWQWTAGDRPRFCDMKKKFSKLRIELYHPQFLLEF